MMAISMMTMPVHEHFKREAFLNGFYKATTFQPSWFLHGGERRSTEKIANEKRQ
jgi:hypothetical protein